MSMLSYRLQISTQSAFATELLGDTLFGQLCWTIRNQFGEEALQNLLVDYTNNTPFAVISNAFPQGMIPKPSLPSVYFDPVADTELKTMKKRVWLSLTALDYPLNEWQQHTKTQDEIAKKETALQMHNSINRLTETTGTGAFAPYAMIQHWYQPNTLLDLYVLFDESRFSSDKLLRCFEDIGYFGYGRDATIGMGKYNIESFESVELPHQNNANAYLTLAPCAPQGLGFDAKNSFYQLFSRFGRHGDIAAHLSGQPFKNPILLTQAGSVFSTNMPKQGFIGQGLGGKGELSKSIIETVHQGYAPVIGFNLPMIMEKK